MFIKLICLIFNLDESGELTNIFSQMFNTQSESFSSIEMLSQKSSEKIVAHYNNMGMSADQFIKTQNMTDVGMQRYLKTVEAGKATVNGYQKSIISAGNSFTVAGVKAKAASIGVGLLNSALNAGIMMLASFAIMEFIKWIDESIVTLEEAKEKLSETESELEIVNDKIEDVVKNIKELEKIETPSITDKEDLERLKAENKELEVRKKYLEWQKQNEEKEISDKAKEKYSVKYSSVSREDIDNYKESLKQPTISSNASTYLTGGSSVSSTSYAAGQQNQNNEEYNNLTRLIAQYEYYSEKKKEAIQNNDGESLEKYNKLLNDTEDKLIESRTELQGFADDMALSGNSDALEEANGTLDLIDQMLFTKRENLVNFLSDKLTSEDSQRLLELAKSGNLTSEVLQESFSEVDDYLKKNGLTIEDLISTLGLYKDELKSIANEAKSLTNVDILSNIQSLSKGLDQLDKIYADVLDGKEFDYSSILNNTDFKDTFEDYDEYSNFIETIANSPNDINACQDAFNKLATAYIYQKASLEDITEENKEATVQMLKQMGVSNAEAVVKEELAKKEAKLAAEKFYNIEASKEMEDATVDDINAMLSEAGAAEIDAKAYAELVAKEIMFSNNGLNVNGKLQALAEVAKYAKTAAIEYSALNDAMNGGGSSKRAFAEENGIGVITVDQRKDGITNKGWQYEYNGKLYENLDEAYLDQQYDVLLKQLNTPVSINYTGGSSSNSAKNGSSDTKETFDWVERLISNIQRTITNLGKTVDATYKKWTTRNSALVEQLSNVRSEIEAQRNAATFYWAKANSVGLSQADKDLVNSGAYSIDDYSGTRKEKLQEYEELANKAKEAEDAIADLEAELADLAKSKFDNVISAFDDELSIIEHRTSMIEGELDQLEAQGYIASTKYYDKLRSLEEENIGKLSEEYTKLKEEFAVAMASGNIEKYSSDWYEMQSAILDVKSALQEANAQLIEYENRLRELEWEIFDKTQEMISQIQEESDWIIELMSNEKLYDDNGNWTKYADAIAGLHAVNYNAYMNQADDYAKEIEEINEDLAKDPYNTLLLERRQELLDSQRDMISNAENEKQAIKDLVSEGYNTMLDALNKIIDKRKEALQAGKDLYDYEKTISEKTKNIGSLEKQLQSYEGDDSEEATAKIQQIKVDLEAAREDLEQTEYERYLSDQEKMLDNLVDDTEQWINERLDHLDEVILGVIDSTNQNREEIVDTLTEATDKVGAALTDEMQTIWGEDGGVVAKYTETFGTQLTGVNNTLTSIRDLVQSMVGASDEEASKDISNVETNVNNVQNTQPASGGAGNTSSTPSNTNQNNSASGNKGSFFVARKYSVPESQLDKERSIVDRLKWKGFNADFSYRAKYYEGMGLGSASSYKATASQNIAMLNWMKKNNYAKGSSRIPKDELAWTQENGQELIYRASDGAMLTPLGAGDAVFTNEMTQRLWDIAKTPNIFSHLTTTALPKGMASNGMNNNIQNDVVMNISLPNVVDGDSFLRVIQTDKRIEKALQSMTLGNALGKNSLNKLKY